MAAPAYAYQAPEPAFPHEITIYTHGDTRPAYYDDKKQIAGSLDDTLSCAARAAPFTYKFSYAPLSRANNLVATMDHVAWFPNGPAQTKEQEKQLIGPIADVKFFWYQIQTSKYDPNSETFKKNALITAYKGSVFENRLRREGYRWIEGSADHNRLLTMLLSGKVDALLAVDFTFKLTGSIKQTFEQRVQTTLYKSLPTYIQVSDYLINNEPAFVDALRTTVLDCLSR